MKKELNKKTYFVNGMHCPSCVLLIEKEVSKLEGVTEVSASLKDNTIEVFSKNNNFPPVTDVNKMLSELGYKVSSKSEVVEDKLSREEVLKVTSLVVLLVLTLWLFEESGFLVKYSINSSSSFFSYFLFGVMAGLSSCAALVGGLLLSLSKQWNSLYSENKGKSYIPFAYFNLSRLLAFALFGGLLGVLGGFIQISIEISTLISGLISFLMLAIGLQMLDIPWFRGFRVGVPRVFSKYITNETNFRGKHMPLIIGALTFFIPCGFTLIAQTNAITSGSFVQGALMLFSFALGTFPLLALISFSSFKFYNNPSFSKKFNLFSGLLVTFFAVYSINSHLNVLNLPSFSDIPNLFSSEKDAPNSKINEGVQLIQIEATGFAYYPTSFRIKAGVPTRLEIMNNGVVGCAQSVYAKGLYPEVFHLEDGLNIVEFTPQTPGTYKISCSMGMVPPVTVTVY